MWNERDMLEVCERFTDDAPTGVVVKEPYIPYKPKNWNGILILAESQAIPSTNDKYAQWLEKLTPKQRMTRLGRTEPEAPYPKEPWRIGIGPWDDKTVQLAMKAVFYSSGLDLELDNIALSNAVPWTCESHDGKNVNPTEQMQAKASQFWKEIFEVWKPDIKALVILGNVAKRVITVAGILSDERYKERCLKLRLPSPNAINRVCGMFDADDLEARFREVKEARQALEMIKDAKQYKREIFFACHAVSLGAAKFKK